MTIAQGNPGVRWVRNPETIPPIGACGFNFLTPFIQWDRLIRKNETFLRGGYYQGQWVVHSGGGWDSRRNMISVFNLSRYAEFNGQCIVSQLGNMRLFDGIPSKWCDSISCDLVLDYVSKDQQMEALADMWRCLKPGGVLCVTVCVAPKSRFNHTIDLEAANKLISQIGLSLPDFPTDGLVFRTQEINPTEEESKWVETRILAFSATKPEAKENNG